MIDLTKPVQTRDGRPARILATDLIGSLPVAAAVTTNGREALVRYSRRGELAPSLGKEFDGDLVNVPEEHVAYLNLGAGYSSESAAQRQHLGWPVLKVTLATDSRGLKDPTAVVTMTKVLPADDA